MFVCVGGTPINTKSVTYDNIVRSSSNSDQNKTNGQEGSTVYLVGLERLLSLLLHECSDCGSLVVKVTDSCPDGHEFKLSTTEDPQCRGVMQVKSVEAQMPFRWYGVEVRRWGASSSVRHLTMVHNYGVHRQKPPKS
ncbi:hypothetical protein TNCV_1909581 [Trichonephila clavipes]|nr:hypothetical protein TNCV_1909581 [Trichonephila clavipes]